MSEPSWDMAYLKSLERRVRELKTAVEKLEKRLSIIERGLGPLSALPEPETKPKRKR